MIRALVFLLLTSAANVAARFAIDANSVLCSSRHRPGLAVSRSNSHIPGRN